MGGVDQVLLVLADRRCNRVVLTTNSGTLVGPVSCLVRPPPSITGSGPCQMGENNVKMLRLHPLADQ